MSDFLASCYQDLLSLDQYYQQDEKSCVTALLQQTPLTEAHIKQAQQLATTLISIVRKQRSKVRGLDAFMAEYDLSSNEGITLMCLAEALLRIPDRNTMDKFIADKLSSTNWEKHTGQSSSLFVNASTWALILTGKLLKPTEKTQRQLAISLKGFLQKHSAPVIRKIIMQAMKKLGQQFVLEQSIDKALAASLAQVKQGYRYSYDMLGEAAMTEADAKQYLQAYLDAVHAIGKVTTNADVRQNPGISVKLSALYARYDIAKTGSVLAILYPRLKAVALLAKQYHIGLTIDAEEARRLTLSLVLFAKLARDPDLSDWQGLGLAVQAYQKRAPYVLHYLQQLASSTQRRFMVRLVKGAYWDSEIKYAQENGFTDYPVFTRKEYTDVSYLANAQFMLQHPDAFYCQFATHNAYTLAAILTMADTYRDFEFQRLHGMGDELYEQLISSKQWPIHCRIYAPVGTFNHLLAYLVRRLLENGANTSFVNRILNTNISLDTLVEDPFMTSKQQQAEPNPHIPTPTNLYGVTRKNSLGINLNDLQELTTVQKTLQTIFATQPWHASSLVADTNSSNGKTENVINPANKADIIGSVTLADKTMVNEAVSKAKAAFVQWQFESVDNNAQRLENLANLLEENMLRLMAITIKEAGKTYANAVAEIREAIDFCRYYAVEAKRLMGQAQTLVGPTGETNQLSLHPRGIIICISPWNFPIAIFTGEVVAALATGNVVIAKPAHQTSLLAYEVVKLMHQAGFPKEVVQLILGSGSDVGGALVSHPDISGVVFTGSNATAQRINIALANKPGPIAALIAETGGQNCMLVDSSALLEQVVRDVVRSAFDSAGQRCSALRVLYVQEDIADALIAMTKGAMQELTVGDPSDYATDVGPVIDRAAQQALEKHIAEIRPQALDFYQTPIDPTLSAGTYVPPTLIEINNIQQLKQENFGPILHVVRFKANELINTFTEINSTGYGLTFGIHSRIQHTIDLAKKHIHAGNIYINRNTVGAVVGVQPFGGEGLSGTGPKAGGPFYLPRLCVERTYSTDTTAAGGNATLLGLGSADATPIKGM